MYIPPVTSIPSITNQAIGLTAMKNKKSNHLGNACMMKKENSYYLTTPRLERRGFSVIANRVPASQSRLNYTHRV